MSDLPGDLVEEILCRVPATSLNQLRYTCKRWNSLFKKRRFIRKQLDKAAKQFLVLMTFKHDSVCLMSVNYYGIPSVEVKAEYSSLVNPQASLDKFEIFRVSPCDGLLLCYSGECKRIVVWNPCTGQTKWVQPRKIGYYALGSYQEYGDKSYKILCCCDDDNNKFEIYEINSNLWRTLDITLEYELEYADLGTSLKGKTYWCASDDEEKQLGMFLVSFDYTTERFERMLLPCHCPSHKTLSLSVVREEKLSVLLSLENTSRTEIWVTNKIDENKVLSWSKVLTVDLKPDEHCTLNVVSFLVDEEKKFLLRSHMEIRHGVPFKDIVYIVGEDNRAKQELPECITCWPFLFHYVPSLTQIQL